MDVAIQVSILLLLISSRYLEYANASGSEDRTFKLLPANNSHVCFGEELTLRCKTDLGYMRWNISIPRDGYKRSRLISFGGSSMFEPLTLDSTIFSFSRLSTSPLVATLTVNSVVVDMRVSCTELSVSVANVLATDVHVIRIRDSLNAPEIGVTRRLFGLQNVTITLAIQTQNASVGALYNTSLSVIPDPIADTISNDTDGIYVQLILRYNTRYSISAVTTLCGETSHPSTVEQYYVGCVNPHQAAVNSSIRISSGHQISTAEGSNVTFSCPPGQALTGLNISTCMGNGEWEPDPWELECKVSCVLPTRNSNISLSFNSTLEGSLLTYRCATGLVPRQDKTAVCHKNGSWVPDPVQHICSTPEDCGPVPSPPSGNVSPYSSTLEGATVTFTYMCENVSGQTFSLDGTTVCNSDGNWEPNPANICGKSSGHSTVIMSCNSGTFIVIASSISVFIISAVVFTILGFICGYCSTQRCNKYTSSRARTPAPDFKIADLDLKRNVAYSSVHPISRAH